MSSKRCTKCGEVKGLEAFSTDKRNSDGRRSRCKACVRRYWKENRDVFSERRRQRYDENRDAERENQRRYYEKNRDVILEYQREYREKNRDTIRECKRRYREENCDAERERSRRYYEKNRSIASETATRNGEPWTAAEDKYLQTSNEPDVVIAVELGRTLGAVADRKRYLRKKALQDA